MNHSFKRAISFVEVAFVIFIIIFAYLFVFKKMFDSMKNTDFMRAAGISMTHLDVASRNISLGQGFIGKFKSEWDMVKLFSEQLDLDKICYDSQSEGCWSNNNLWTNPRLGFRTKNNEFVIMNLYSSSCSSKMNIPNTCGEIIIDTNGNGQPNRVGQDILKFYVVKSGLIPAGIREDRINSPDDCDFVHNFSWGCTAKLLNVK